MRFAGAGRAAALAAALMAFAWMAAPGWAQDVVPISPAGLQAILAPPLTPAPQGPLAGREDDPKAQVTVVEYFDYQCPVCRSFEPTLEQLLASDPHVKVVRKDWPIFGALSVYAAYCALAAEHFGQYPAAHRALMTAHGRFESREQIEGLLRQAGLDLDAIKGYVATQQLQLGAVLTRNQAEADALGLKGTPGLVVGDVRVNGAPPLPYLQRLVERARAKPR